MSEKQNNKVATVEKQMDFVVDPNIAVESAQRAANALLSKIKAVQIGAKKYLTFEHLQTIGRFYGLTVGVEWSKKTENGYEARAVVYRKSEIVSAAEAICTREERNWKNRDEYALKSMAQTRACAKALRNVVAWVAVIAGFEGTPAEEIVEEEKEVKNGNGKCPGCKTTGKYHAKDCSLKT